MTETITDNDMQLASTVASDLIVHARALSNFDPTRYLSKVSGRDYLQVMWRLVWLRAEHPDASIETDLVQLINAEYAVFKAVVSFDVTDRESGEVRRVVTTGHGTCDRNSFENFVEKAETKAIGRALGAAGYGTQFADDFEDDPNDVRQLADTPRDRSSQNYQPRQQTQQRSQGGSQQGDGGTPSQKKFIERLVDQLGWDDAQLDALSNEITGLPANKLNAGQASALIDALKAKAPRSTR